MERHRYSILIVALFIIASVFLQSKLPLWFPRASWTDLPLVVTLYFGLSYRDSLRGLAVGLVAGLLQDALSHGPLGLNGLTKTLVGYLASRIGSRFEVEQGVIRLVAVWGFSVVHLALFALCERLFLTARFSWDHYHFVFSPLLNAVVGWPIFLLGDRLRKKD